MGVFIFISSLDGGIGEQVLQVWSSLGSTNVMFTLLTLIAYSTSYVLLVLAAKLIFLISLLVLASHHSWLGKIHGLLHACITRCSVLEEKLAQCLKRGHFKPLSF